MGVISGNHTAGRSTIIAHLTASFAQHVIFLEMTFFENMVKPTIALFTQQMQNVATHQASLIGMMFDAQNQLDAERLHQQLRHQTHVDYQPSKGFCAIGTSVRSLAASERQSQFMALSIADAQIKRNLGHVDSAGADISHDLTNRWHAFRTTYCNKADGNGNLDEVCDVSNGNIKRINSDIDYTRMIEVPRTLEIAYKNDTLTPKARDILALSHNLFGHTPITRKFDKDALVNPDNRRAYFKLRAVSAKRAVAESSFNAIVGMKAQGSAALDGNTPRTREFMAAIMRDLGVGAELGNAEDQAKHIYGIIGDNPSYFAQLEILAKRIYQSPSFFAGLYDKPVNVARKSAALSAIENMIDREIYESQLRQEMNMSVLLSTQLEAEFEKASPQIGSGGG